MASPLPGGPVAGADVRLDCWPPSTDADGRVLEEQVPSPGTPLLNSFPPLIPEPLRIAWAHVDLGGGSLHPLTEICEHWQRGSLLGMFMP